MSTFDLLPELADRLDALVPAEVSAGDWDDVLRRATRSHRRDTGCCRSSLRSRSRCSCCWPGSRQRRTSSFVAG